MKIRIVNRSKQDLQAYITDHTVGMNLRENILEGVVIKDSDRICRMIIAKHERVYWIAVGELRNIGHGPEGLSHTGRN
jgi:dUTPase